MKPANDITVTCPACSAKGVTLTGWTLGSHYAGRDDSGPVAIYVPGACQGVRLTSEQVFRMLLDRDVFGTVAA